MYIGELLLDSLQKEQINIINNLHMSGQQPRHKRNRPLFQRLLHHRMIRIAERRRDDFPCLIPLHVFNVDENPLEFDDRQCGMGVIELNGDLIREFRPRPFGFFEAADDVVEGGAAPKILLFQTEFCRYHQMKARELGTKRRVLFRCVEKVYLPLPTSTLSLG